MTKELIVLFDLRMHHPVMHVSCHLQAINCFSTELGNI
jgi:hypothetical protein